MDPIEMQNQEENINIDKVFSSNMQKDKSGKKLFQKKDKKGNLDNCCFEKLCLY
jgi:hypothetical protein